MEDNPGAKQRLRYLDQKLGREWNKRPRNHAKINAIEKEIAEIEAMIRNSRRAGSIFTREFKTGLKNAAKERENKLRKFWGGGKMLKAPRTLTQQEKIDRFYSIHARRAGIISNERAAEIRRMYPEKYPPMKRKEPAWLENPLAAKLPKFYTAKGKFKAVKVRSSGRARAHIRIIKRKR